MTEKFVYKDSSQGKARGSDLAFGELLFCEKDRGSNLAFGELLFCLIKTQAKERLGVLI